MAATRGDDVLCVQRRGLSVHEFALAHSMLKIALESAGANRAIRVTKVCCRIGAMRQVVPSLLQTAFEACCMETIAEGAKLSIEIAPITVTCDDCGAGREMDTLQYQCPACDSARISLEGGTAMEITSIDIDQEDDDGHSSPTERAGTQRRHGG